ncbi:BrnT family toxin [Gemmatimonas sp.]|uniref:BrnT family toxin n=1 Tax=Gemmatimonas sp. TaxID=1962908 RepID=UPI0022C47D8C|nr:BrnT family toxin [Gemmatimonas sp.]MCZ8203810.1 BrnT family toxin [Gemmatimonas sp.]
MEFEFDPLKSASNFAKHGIDFDFDAAQALWRDDRLLEVRARTTDEPRWLVVGRIAGVVWSAVVTYRDDRVRLISVRRARAEEVALYEGEGL